MDDWSLLERYVRERSEEAFAQLVRRHVDWVYAAAKRTIGEQAAAEDATQAVFILLARKAGTLSRRVRLSGWMFNAVQLISRDVLKLKARRNRHEREAAVMRPEIQGSGPEVCWDDVAPQLDGAVARLGSAQREAILLRFYREMPLAEVGVNLGISEEAAKKRVARAVQKLRDTLVKSGVQLGVVGLEGALLERMQEVAPDALAGKLTLSAVQGVGCRAATELAKGAARALWWVKVKAVAGGLAAAIALAGGISVATVASNARISGTLLLPDGRPAGGAAVYAVSGNVHVVDPMAGFSERGPTSRPGAHAPQTGENGEFGMWNWKKDVMGVAFVHPGGFRFMGRGELLKQSNRVMLENWAKIEGSVSPSLGVPGGKVKLIYEWDFTQFTYELETRVRPDGSFAFEHVPPGRVSVGPVLELSRFRTGMTFMDHRTWVSTEPGQIVKVVVGGSGATVKARAVLENGERVSSDRLYAYAHLSESLGPVPFAKVKEGEEQARKATKDPAEQMDTFRRWVASPEGRPVRDYQERQGTLYTAFPDAQGEMVFAGIPAGPYKIRVYAEEFNHERSWGLGKLVGIGEKDVTVGESGIVDAGEVRVLPKAVR